MDTRRSKSEREAKDNLENDGGEGKKQGGVDELGSSQSNGTEQGVLVGKRDGLMRLLARRDMMMIRTALTQTSLKKSMRLLLVSCKNTIHYPMTPWSCTRTTSPSQ